MTERDLERLAEAGVYGPSQDDAAEQRALLERLLAQGLTVDDLTSAHRLGNLVLLCFHHHRLVHEGGYTVEDDGAGRFRFRNRSGVLTANLPPRPPPGWAGELLAENDSLGLEVGPRTNQHGGYHEFDLGAAVSAISSAFG